MTSAAGPLDRHSIRLAGYDYSQPGAYFVTMVTARRQCLFGEIIEQEMRLNRFGEIVRSEWRRTPEIRCEIELGAFVVMPNHFHGIVVISGDAPMGASPVGATGTPCAPLRDASRGRPYARAVQTPDHWVR